MEELVIFCAIVFVILLVILLFFTISLISRLSELNDSLGRLVTLLKTDKPSQATSENRSLSEAEGSPAEANIPSAEEAFPSLAAAFAAAKVPQSPPVVQQPDKPPAEAPLPTEQPKTAESAPVALQPIAEPAPEQKPEAPPSAALTPEQKLEAQALVETLQNTEAPEAAEQSHTKTPDASAETENTEPREPSAIERRLKLISNWLVYGRAEGVPPGESAEKMLATTWLLRSGILVILFTSVFLLKLSIDKGLLAPSGRVALSYIAGAALLLFGLSRRMRERYWSLGQALCGISLGVFYFSSFAMTSMYHLVSAIIGGAVMCLTTVTAGVLADKLNSISVGMVAMIGGYATPLLLNTGVKNFPGLSAYLILLGIGVLWLAYRRNWQQLTWLSMLFTYGLFALAMKTHYAEADFAVCQTALCLFFILFSTTVFIHNVRKGIPAAGLEILGLLGNSTLFFALSWWTIGSVNHGDKLYFAPLTLGLAAYYLLHAVFLGRRRNESLRGLLLIFCALSGFYLALTFPVVLSGEWLAAAWALQAFMMLWLGHKLDSRLVRNCAWVLYAMTLVHLCGHEFWGYSALVRKEEASFWGSVIARLFQYLLPVASLAAAAQLTMKRNAETQPGESELSTPEGTPLASRPRSTGETLAGVLLGVSFVVLFLFLRLEIGVDLHHSAFWLTGVNIVWIGGCITAVMLLKRGFPGWWHLFLAVLLGGTLLRGFIDFFNTHYWGYYTQFQWMTCFNAICNTAVLVLGIMICGRMMPEGRLEHVMNRVCRISWPILLFIHSTREWGMIIKHKLPGLSGGGISVLWAIFAFVMVFRGITKSLRSLRYIGLALFAIVVCKVFLIDMGHLEAIYRVVAFFVFGVLLMGAAFVYLKYWHNKEEK